MQMSKPTSPLIPAIPAAPQAANAASTPHTNASSTPFAALLESHHAGAQPKVAKTVDPEARKEPSVIQPNAEKKSNTSAASERAVDRQLERNRLNAQREARQLASRTPAGAKAPTPSPVNAQGAKAPKAPTPEGTQGVAEEKADNTKDERGLKDNALNPLALWHWLSDPNTPPPLGMEATGLAAQVAALDETGAQAGHEQPASSGMRAVFSTIKTAADHSATIAAALGTEKALSGSTGLAAKLHTASGLLAKAALGQMASEQKTDLAVTTRGGETNAPTPMAAMGLDGWAKAVGTATAETPAVSTPTVNKAQPSAATADLNGSPPPFAVGPRSSGTDSSVATTATLAAPVQSPEFRELLSQQVTLWTKDGVQAAELHLNPADMGTVSVQITLDGTQARVDFGADSAQTRQFIEAGLPELASALQDAGFTLSGGGVSPQARGREDQPASNSPGVNDRRTEADALSDTAQPTPASARRVALGGVDVYA